MAKRPLWMVAVLLLGTAAALWGAGEVSWYPEVPREQDDSRGPALLTPGIDMGTGGPDFTALALLALASLAGVFALSGWPRRLLGGVLVVAGGYVCWRSLTADVGFDLLTGRGLGLLGGLLFVAAGVLVFRYATVLPTMGARYERADAERRSGDPEKDLWDGLSDGRDPTVDGPRT